MSPIASQTPSSNVTMVNPQQIIGTQRRRTKMVSSLRPTLRLRLHRAPPRKHRCECYRAQPGAMRRCDVGTEKGQFFVCCHADPNMTRWHIRYSEIAETCGDHRSKRLFYHILSIFVILSDVNPYDILHGPLLTSLFIS